MTTMTRRTTKNEKPMMKIVYVAGPFRASTPWGIEKTDPTRNQFYTHSYIFSVSTPRTLTGLTARWEDIAKKAESGKAPQQLYAEPDLVIKVVRDLFNEDFTSLVVDGADAWDNINGYISHVAPDLAGRVERCDGLRP